MAVRIQLDRPYSHFTNLDHITGKVIFTLITDETISAIVVKLEGESRTRLAGPRSVFNDRPDRSKTEIEVHKVSEYLHLRLVLGRALLTNYHIAVVQGRHCLS